MFHLALHFIIPALLTGLFFRNSAKTAFFLMIATMLVDLDHLLANPVYDPTRCSIGFHPLHQPGLIMVYAGLCLIPNMPKVRFIGLGLLVHMILDAIDCQVTNGLWMN